ncbi:MAG: hypothetical protein P4L82_04220 [Ancalomicrobiaceae bacterium]|nr:hypothetical protein [Ancalomicrobiaceae bacterium]
MAVDVTKVYRLTDTLKDVTAQAKPIKLADWDTTLNVPDLVLAASNVSSNGAATDPKDAQNFYASIQKNGKTVALVYRDGSYTLPSAVSAPADLANGTPGTGLAETRLAQLGKALGGTVQYAKGGSVQGLSSLVQAASSQFLAQLLASQPTAVAQA